MHSQTRIVIGMLATALVAAVVASAARTDFPPAAPAVAESGAISILPGPPPFASADGVERVTDREKSGVPTTPERTPAGDASSGGRPRITDEDRIRLRASTLARKLELTAAEAEALLAVLLQEQDRRAAAFAAMSGELNEATAKVRVRGELDSIRAWKASELRRQFGVERSDIILMRR